MATSGGGTGFSTANPGNVRVQDGAGTGLATVYGSGVPDGQPASPGMLQIAGLGQYFNGASLDRARSASAANLAAGVGLGVGLVTPPGMAITAVNAAANVQASVTIAAGAAGVRHVLWGLIASLMAGSVAPAAFVGTVNIINGATGGAAIARIPISLPATAGASSPYLLLTDINYPGLASTALTVEFNAAAGANTFEGITILTYDVS